MRPLLRPETREFFARYLLATYVLIIARAGFVLGLRPDDGDVYLARLYKISEVRCWSELVPAQGAGISTSDVRTT